MRAFLFLGVVSLLVFVAAEIASAWPIVQLTDNDFDDTMPQVSGNNVAWTGGSGSQINVFFYDGAVHKLTDGSFYDNGSICLDGNRVAWTGCKASGSSEVFLFDGQATRQITDNGVNDNYPALWNGGVAWLGYEGTDYEIFNYNGTSTVQLTDDVYEQYSISTSGQYLGWVTEETRVMRYDGQSIAQVTENSEYYPFFGIMLSEKNVLLISWLSRSTFGLEICTPEGREYLATISSYSGAGMDISGSRVAWSDWVNIGGFIHHGVIFLWDEGEFVQITENNQMIYSPSVSDLLVAWECSDGNDSEIFLYDGSDIIQVTNNDSNDKNPQISGFTLAWQHWDGDDWEIQMVTVPEPDYMVLSLLGLLCFGSLRAHSLYIKKLY